MEATLYAKILSDDCITDLRKLGYKYPDVDIGELIGLLKTSVYKSIPVWDFNGNDIVYMENIAKVKMSAVKLLLTPQNSGSTLGLKAMEGEIASTLAIESIDFNRESVRKILRGYAPVDEHENRIYGLKKGLDYISQPGNTMSEENIFALYDMAIGQYLQGEDRLNAGARYRHDDVYIIGQTIEHTGLPHQKLPSYIERLAAFIGRDRIMDDLIKAAVIHFYFAYLHPYFDGNGRMARMLHMWYLRQQGYSSALFIPFSSYIERSRQKYYKAYTLIAENAKISKVIDITPFLVYFIENVYNKLEAPELQHDALQIFGEALEKGEITEKEKDLWSFVLSAYGDDGFSTKQLERDFRNAAYATIRGFVLKFTKLQLLTAQKYGNRVKYAVKTHR
ncbi:MAG: Fic family protein [Oscillospiraceae bacterium]|nr:Fic family protein [Oscillospiraceae bacterium]